MSTLFDIWHTTQTRLFPWLEERIDPTAIAKVFVAKAVYNFETTKVLIEYLRGCKNLRRLCGWETWRDIPSESTFSRAFAEYAQGCLPQKIHEAMVKAH